MKRIKLTKQGGINISALYPIYSPNFQFCILIARGVYSYKN